MSHEHNENNAGWRINGNPLVVKRTSTFPCEHEIHVPRTNESFLFKGTPTYHDESLGKRRGPNTVFTWSMDRMRVCFLGDLGHVLDDKQVTAIGHSDILFIPVGGKGITIGPKEATIVIDQLQPLYIIPMTYKHPAISWDIEQLDTFLVQMSQVDYLKKDCFEFSSPPSTAKVVVFQLPNELQDKRQGG